VHDPKDHSGSTYTEWIDSCIEMADGFLARHAEVAESAAQRDFADALAAAKDGSSLAQYRVAECYLIGHGVPRDPLTGYAWMWVSARAGNEEAAECLSEAHLPDDAQATILNLVASMMPAPTST
jgi:TPR repeat protein